MPFYHKRDDDEAEDLRQEFKKPRAPKQCPDGMCGADDCPRCPKLASEAYRSGAMHQRKWTGLRQEHERAKGQQ